MRLIDADKLIEKLRDFKEWENDDGRPIHTMSETQRIDRCINFAQTEPTAYDINKVVEELNELDVKSITRYKNGNFGNFDGVEYYIKKKEKQSKSSSRAVLERRVIDMTIDEIKKAIREIEISYDYNHRKNDYDIVLNLTELANLIKTLQGKAIDDFVENIRTYYSLKQEMGYVATTYEDLINYIFELAEQLKAGVKNE